MQAHNRHLSEWFNRVRSGQLRLPRFQRFEAWNHARVEGLLETVLQGLPAGAALILEVGDKELFRSRPIVGAPQPTERVTEHLLDGQQRVTALWRSLHDDYEDRTYFINLAATPESERNSIVDVVAQPRWFRDGKKYPLWANDVSETYAKGYLPVKLLRPGDMTKEITAWCKAAVGGNFDLLSELSARITELRERVATFNLPYLALPTGTSKETAINVFVEMNTSAAQLTPFDIVVAQVEDATGESLQDLVASVKGSAPAVECYTDPSDLVLSVAAMREDRPATIASYYRLDLQKLVNEWDDIVKGIAFAIEFIESEGIFDGKRLPTTNVLPVIATLHGIIPPNLDGFGSARTTLRKYIWRSFVTRRYENNAATRALQDLRGLRGVLIEGKSHSSVPIFDELEYPLPTVDELIRAGWPKKRDILARGILAVSLRGGALDIADGQPVTRGKIDEREYHHLFPDALVSRAAEEEGASYRALNCALVTWNTNRNISAKEPVKYLKDRVERALLGEVEIRSRLATHAVPFDQLNVGGYDLLSKHERKERVVADYECFLRARAEIVSCAIQQLCDGHSWTGMVFLAQSATANTQ